MGYKVNFTDTAKECLLQIAEYIAHGLISLDLTEKRGELKRSLVVIKMRGTKHSMKIYPFEITDEGITILSGELY